MAGISSSTHTAPNLKMVSSLYPSSATPSTTHLASATAPTMPLTPTSPINMPQIDSNPFSRPEDSIDYVTVADPVIHVDGINKYTSYRVDCRPPLNDNNTGPGSRSNDFFLQNNQGQYSSVLRRYSDFLWLYERLHKGNFLSIFVIRFLL